MFAKIDVHHHFVPQPYIDGRHATIEMTRVSTLTIP